MKRYRAGNDQDWDGADDLDEDGDQAPDAPAVSATRRQVRPSPPEASRSVAIRTGAITWLARVFLMFAFAATCMLVLTIILTLQNPKQQPLAVVSILASQPTKTPTVTPTPLPPPLALVAGHSGGIDPGAICADGLREVDVTTDVAERVRAILTARKYRVEILAEFDPRLTTGRHDYSPQAFLAIHADSCVYYASGYKVARAANSGSPSEDDRLVRCVSAAYAAATLLPFHAGSITSDMTQYHGLNAISAQTPGAIIELGFLGSEHDLLMYRRQVVAEGVANGLDDFLRGDRCGKVESSKQ